MENLASLALGLIVGFVTGATLAAVTFLGLIALGGRIWGRPQSAAGRTALRAQLLLDDFATSCHAAAFDTPEYDEDDPGHYFMHTDEPNFILPDDVDWSVLGAEIEEALVRMPSVSRNVTRGLEHLDAAPKLDDAFFEKRRGEYVRLGLLAFDLADRIEREFSIASLERPVFFQPREDLLRELRNQQSADLGRQTASQAQSSGGSNVTSIFAARKLTQAD